MPANQWLDARRRNLAATVTEEKKGTSSAAPPDRLGKLGYGFLWLCLGVVCLWTVCTIAIYWLFPDWQTRGAVGDSFGAVSALFSGLAFAGLIYALHLQRKELIYQREELLATRTVSEAQLAEMRASRQLLAQPVALPEVKSFEVQRPRLFYTPPEDKHSALSRYTVLVLLSNPSQHSAIAVNVRCFLQFGEPRKVLGSTDHYISLVGPGAQPNELGSQSDFLFSGDSDGLLFDSLRQRDPRKVPALLVIALFKNVVGAHFRLRRAFQLYAHGGQAESLQHWATRLAAFQVEYKSQLTDLRELRRKGQEDKWEYLFEKLKNDFSGSVMGPETVALHAEAVPASFSLECISPEEFQREMSFASYPQIVGALYDCPVELDMRGKS